MLNVITIAVSEITRVTVQMREESESGMKKCGLRRQQKMEREGQQNKVGLNAVTILQFSLFSYSYTLF